MESVELPNKKHQRGLSDEGTSSSSFANVAYTGHQSSRQKNQRLSRINVDSQTRATSLLQLQTPGGSIPSPDYIDLGDCTCVCEFCGAMFWFEERVMSSPLSQRPAKCNKHNYYIINTRNSSSTNTSNIPKNSHNKQKIGIRHRRYCNRKLQKDENQSINQQESKQQLHGMGN